MNSSIFDNVDVDVACYAAFMAVLISLLQTARERNRQRSKGLPLSPWLTVLPDMLLGTLVGLGLALNVPPNAPMFNNVTGIAFLAGFGGIVGPKLWDLISSDGLRIGLRALAAYLAGPLKNLASAAEQAAEPKVAADTAPPPATPPPVSPPAPSAAPPIAVSPTPSPEVGEHDGQAPSAADPFDQPSSVQELPDEDAS